MSNYTFNKTERLHTKREFKRVFENGKSYTNNALTVFVRKQPTDSADSSSPSILRLGLVVSRKLAKAVKRNRLKRRLREIFRLNKHLLKSGYDIVFIPKQESIELDFYTLKKTVFTLWEKAGILK